MRTSIAALALALALAGCTSLIEEHVNPIGGVTAACVVRVPAGFMELPAPASLELPDASLWIWPELVRTDGTVVANASARVASVTEACAGPNIDETPLLALAPDEVAANAMRSDGRRLALVPTGGVADATTGALYYEHVVLGPGLFDAEVLGTGLCIIGPSRPCERVAANGSTILWRPDQRVMNHGGIVIDDGGPFAVLAGCRRVASFLDPCTITGVPLARVRDPSAYRVFDVFAGWVDRLVDASVFADSPGELTLSHFDGAFLATRLDIFDNRIAVQWSANAVSAYGPPIPTVDVPPPEAGFATGGREHAALRTQPRSIVVSYHTTNASAPGLHLVALELFGEGELR